jgi:hypothetical protein
LQIELNNLKKLNTILKQPKCPVAHLQTVEKGKNKKKIKNWQYCRNKAQKRATGFCITRNKKKYKSRHHALSLRQYYCVLYYANTVKQNVTIWLIGCRHP